MCQTKHYNKNKFRDYTEEETLQIHQSFEKITRRRKNIINLIETTSEILSDSTSLVIDLRDDFDLGQINTIAALMGSSPNNLQIQEMVTQDTMQKCKSEEVYGVSTGQNHCYTNRKLAKRMFDFYLFFTNGMELSDLYPIVKEGFDACKAAIDSLEKLNYSLETKQNLKMCPYCGKKRR